MKVAKIEAYDPVISIIHEQNFDFGWNDSYFIELLAKPTTLAYKIELNDQIQSFIFLSYISDESEILTLATRPDCQNRGLATALLKAVIDDLRPRGVEAVCLEVAIDNSAALKLYQKFGFIKVGLRKAYYRRRLGPPVDGQVLRLDLRA